MFYTWIWALLMVPGKVKHLAELYRTETAMKIKGTDRGTLPSQLSINGLMKRLMSSVKLAGPFLLGTDTFCLLAIYISHILFLGIKTRLMGFLFSSCCRTRSLPQIFWPFNAVLITRCQDRGMSKRQSRTGLHYKAVVINHKM